MIDLLILYVLLKRDLTMYAIHKRILESFCPYTTPSFGAIKPALVRLEKNGMISYSSIMSDGGKLSKFYSITKEGMKKLKSLLLEPLSSNPLQFYAEAGIRLSCASFLDKSDCEELFMNIKSTALLHKSNAEKVLSDEYISVDFYQRMVLDNSVCGYKNIISLVEGLEKDNAGNSK